MAARPLVLDAFCGEGGASEGYRRAGFDVVGVDIQRWRRYPFRLIQADALQFLATANLTRFALIHASPPCQRWTRGGRRDYPDLLTPARALLQASGRPWVIENVPLAPLRRDLVLCACMFPELDLRLMRVRAFETSWHEYALRQPCRHGKRFVSVLTKGARYETTCNGRRAVVHVPHAEAGRMMGAEWMSQRGLGEAIPPAYTEYIGRLYLLRYARERSQDASQPGC